MRKKGSQKKCRYCGFCYIAEAADCFGYRLDCPLYMVTNDQTVGENTFHRAMNELIDMTKFKHAQQKK